MAEDVESGLKAALEMKWMMKNKIVFHIADSSSHGTFYTGKNDMCVYHAWADDTS